MDLFSTRHVVLACGRCGSLVAYASHRVVPGRLDLRELDGPPLVPERAGRVLQRLRANAPADSPPPVWDWLDHQAVELVYRLPCPQDGPVWAAVPDITAAIRAAGRGTTVPVPTH